MATSKSGGLKPGLWMSAGAGKGRGKGTRRRLRKAVSNMGGSLGTAGDIEAKEESDGAVAVSKGRTVAGEVGTTRK